MSLLKNAFIFLLSLFFAFALSEGVIVYLSKSGYFKIDFPSYNLNQQYQSYWADINSDFGVWHLPHSEYRHLKSCFNVTYHANAYGARDKERSKENAFSRVLVIGDSFVEGYGLPEEARLSNILETKTGLEHLNFGTSGHFGPTQYYLLYKHLAKGFSHDMVIVMILPINDFFDDDPEFGRKVHYTRYRPYWIGEYPHYQLQYFREKLEPEQLHLVKRFLKNFTYTYNAIERVFEVHRLRSAMTEIRDFSGYYDYSEKQWDRMKFSLEKIIEEAKGKKVIFVSIPVESDYNHYGKDSRLSISERLKAFSRKENVLYIDLLEKTLQEKLDWKQLAQSCDDHWSAAQSQAVSSIILDEIHKKYLGFYPSLQENRGSNILPSAASRSN